MRRLLAATGAAALGLAIVMPVARAVVPPGGGTSLDWWTPVKYDQQGRANQQPSTAPDGAAVYSTDEVVTVKAHFSSTGNTPGGVKSWNIQIVPLSGGAPSTCSENIAPDNNGRYTDDAYISCPWDTTRNIDRTLDQPTPSNQVQDQGLQRNWHLNDHGPSVNGKYEIRVFATSAGQLCGLLTCSWNGPQTQYELYEDANAQRWRQVWVNNDVSDPTGVGAGFDPGSNRITVTWAANPEPDVSYLVQEKVGDGKWSGGVAVPGTATNYVKAIDQPGKYQYQVAAVRPAPTADSGKGASATKTSNYVAAQAVTVAQVSPPTTAAAGPNGPSGTIDQSDAGGVNLPSDAPASTAPGSHVAEGAKGGAAVAAGHGGGPSGGGPRPASAGLPGGSSTQAAGGEAEGEGPDSGFSSTLPYQPQGGSVDGLGSSGNEIDSMSKIVKVPRPQGARALLVPLAISLAMFVFAMQMTFLVRRSRPATATPEDDFDDWMSF
jgi:hypothetical protein